MIRLIDAIFRITVTSLVPSKFLDTAAPNPVKLGRIENSFIKCLQLMVDLLILDNFNVTRDQDEFLDVILKYRCRILFTTRSRYENQIPLEVKELPVDTLLALMGKFVEKVDV